MDKNVLEDEQSEIQSNTSSRVSKAESEEGKYQNDIVSNHSERQNGSVRKPPIGHNCRYIMSLESIHQLDLINLKFQHFAIQRSNNIA